MKTKTITKTVFINPSIENMPETRMFHGSRFHSPRSVPNSSTFTLLRRNSRQVEAKLVIEVEEETVELTKGELTKLLQRLGGEYITDIVNGVF